MTQPRAETSPSRGRATEALPSTTRSRIKHIFAAARSGYQPPPEEVRYLLAHNGETQRQAAERIGIDPRTIRRAVSPSHPYTLSAHAWALLRVSYLTEIDGPTVRGH